MSSQLAIVPSMAPMIATNPNQLAVADFPFAGDTSLAGMVTFAVGDYGQVNVNVDLVRVPEGAITYRIHQQPVGWRSPHCDGAGGVFDPYGAGDVECNHVANYGLCAVGDLSGKHGTSTGSCFQQDYLDPYLSLDSYSPAFFVGRSLVVYRDGKPVACSTIKYRSVIVEEEKQAELEKEGLVSSVSELETTIEITSTGYIPTSTTVTPSTSAVSIKGSTAGATSSTARSHNTSTAPVVTTSATRVSTKSDTSTKSTRVTFRVMATPTGAGGHPVVTSSDGGHSTQISMGLVMAIVMLIL